MNIYSINVLILFFIGSVFPEIISRQFFSFSENFCYDSSFDLVKYSKINTIFTINELSNKNSNYTLTDVLKHKILANGQITHLTDDVYNFTQNETENNLFQESKGIVVMKNFKSFHFYIQTDEDYLFCVFK